MKNHQQNGPRLVVAVPSITPVFALWNSETNQLKRVYGGNVCENSVYTDGTMPKLFRMAAEEDNYHNELILHPLPNTIEEVALNESPECQLVILNFKTLELPEEEETPGCRILRHPAAPTAEDLAEQLYFEKKVAELAKKARRCHDKKQLFLFPEIEPKTLTGS